MFWIGAHCAFRAASEERGRRKKAGLKRSKIRLSPGKDQTNFSSFTYLKRSLGARTSMKEEKWEKGSTIAKRVKRDCHWKGSSFLVCSFSTSLTSQREREEKGEKKGTYVQRRGERIQLCRHSQPNSSCMTTSKMRPLSGHSKTEIDQEKEKKAPIGGEAPSLMACSMHPERIEQI